MIIRLTFEVHRGQKESEFIDTSDEYADTDDNDDEPKIGFRAV